MCGVSSSAWKNVLSQNPSMLDAIAAHSPGYHIELMWVNDAQYVVARSRCKMHCLRRIHRDLSMIRSTTLAAAVQKHRSWKEAKCKQSFQIKYFRKPNVKQIGNNYNTCYITNVSYSRWLCYPFTQLGMRVSMWLHWYNELRMSIQVSLVHSKPIMGRHHHRIVTTPATQICNSCHNELQLPQLKVVIPVAGNLPARDRNCKRRHQMPDKMPDKMSDKM